MKNSLNSDHKILSILRVLCLDRLNTDKTSNMRIYHLDQCVNFEHYQNDVSIFDIFMT